MFGKVMSIPDELMVKYYRLASALPVDEIDEIERGLAADELHPNKVKRALAQNIVAAYYDEAAAQAAEEQFDLVFKQHAVSSRPISPPTTRAPSTWPSLSPMRAWLPAPARPGASSTAAA